MGKIFKIEQHQTRTLKWWNSRRDKIDFEPPYQRKGRLWSPHDKAFLIDSILMASIYPSSIWLIFSMAT